MSVAVVLIVGVLVVVGATTLAPKVGVASPLLLVALGVAASFVPLVGPVSVPPEWILAGVLPPLLYSAAVSAPVMELRRDVRLISVFSVLLVVASAVAVGLLARALVPGLPLGVGIALGAVVSPTDAVATSIVRRANVSPRLVAVLQGESMLNDASALVLLRSAVAAVGVTVSLTHVAGEFLWAVAVAVVIGLVVGKLSVMLRSRVGDTNAGVALSLVVPYVAYLPTEHLGGSGLVAAVTAGVVAGYAAPRSVGARDRLTERTVWGTVELLLESAVFLLVGLELRSLVADLTGSGGSIGWAVVIAVLCATVVLAVRTVFVSGSVWALARRNRRAEGMRTRLGAMKDMIDNGGVPRVGDPARSPRGGPGGPDDRLAAQRRRRGGPGRILDTEKMAERRRRWEDLVRRRLADIDYLAAEQFGWCDGVILVWAGMRGAVTVAAAQSLPDGTPERSLVVFVATVVAVGTLVVQGATLTPLATRLGLTGRDAIGDPEQWTALQHDLTRAGADRLEGYAPEVAGRMREWLARLEDPDDHDFGTEAQRAQTQSVRDLRLDMIAGQRERLLALRALGTYPSAMLDAAMTQLDAEQISIELRR